MADLATHLSTQLGEAGYEVPIEVLQEHIDSFEAPAKPKAKVVPAKSKVAGKAKAATGHKCEYTIMSKTEGAKLCEKPAKNEHEGAWYCGTDKSGHYKSALSRAEAPIKSAKVAPKAKAKVPAKAANVFHKITKETDLNALETPKGSGVWVILDHHRIVMDKDMNPPGAMGCLDDDEAMVNPLTEEATAFCEVHGMPISERAVSEPTDISECSSAAPKAKVAKAKTAIPAKVAKTVVPAKAAPKVAAPAKAKTAPAKAKVAAPKAKAKIVPAKAKTVAKLAPAKAKAKSKAKSKAVTEDDSILEELQQQVEDISTEPEPVIEEEGVEEENEEEEEEVNIDLGDEEEPVVDENEEEGEANEDVQDIEETDEGDVIDDVEEDEPEEDEE